MGKTQGLFAAGKRSDVYLVWEYTEVCVCVCARMCACMCIHACAHVREREGERRRVRRRHRSVRFVHKALRVLSTVHFGVTHSYIAYTQIQTQIYTNISRTLIRYACQTLE